jgi:translation initiation factor IF-3
VRVIKEDGESAGIISIQEAMDIAEQAELDLVEVAPNADPPVCRVMDYGKFKYEKSKKAKEAKKKQHIVHLKEIKLHPKTDEHDYQFKMDHARKFIFKGDRVKATIVFRGREINHLEFGRKILERFTQDMSDIAQVEQDGKLEGRNMISIFVPDKAKVKDVLRKMEKQRREEEAKEK